MTGRSKLCLLSLPKSDRSYTHQCRVRATSYYWFSYGGYDLAERLVLFLEVYKEFVDLIPTTGRHGDSFVDLFHRNYSRGR